MNQPDNSKRLTDNKARKIINVLVFSLIILILFLVIRESQHQQKIETVIQYEQEKNTLRDNLDDLIDEHELLKDEYSELSEQLSQRDSTIMAYADEIKQLIRTKGQLQQAKQKIKRLKQISMKYVSAIDSLLVLNQKLQFENDSVRRANKLIERRNLTLEKDNQKLSERVFTASMLRLENIEIDGVYYRSSGREVITSRASKIQNISICFDVVENKVAESGKKTIYIRMIDPDGDVLTVANKIQELSISKDSLLQYTVAIEFDYENEFLNHCQLWTRGNVLKRGLYSFEFIQENQLIGSVSRKFR